MKLSKEAMAIFVESVGTAIAYVIDASWLIREMDLIEGEEDGKKVLVLSEESEKKFKAIKQNKEVEIEMIKKFQQKEEKVH